MSIRLPLPFVKNIPDICFVGSHKGRKGRIGRNRPTLFHDHGRGISLIGQTMNAPSVLLVPCSLCHAATTGMPTAPRAPTCDPPHQGTISALPICLFLLSADISNLFELFFIQNYLYTPRFLCDVATTSMPPAPRAPTCDLPHQGTISTLPICLFLPSADISNLFELFFTQNYLYTPRFLCDAATTSMPTAPRTLTCDLPYQYTISALPICFFLLSADISNLFELFFTQNYLYTPTLPCAMSRLPACPRCPEPPHAVHHIKAPSAPSYMPFFAER